MKPLFEYCLRLADNGLILGQRLSEWCGHGPVLEQDMALTNIALDQIGQARSLYQYAGEIEGKGRDEDQLALLRSSNEYRNALLVEQPNGHFGHTVLRQYLFDAFNHLNYTALCQSKSEQLRAIAEKSLKEITYHLRWSSEWVVRLGDGTEESHSKMEEALDDLWMFAGELVTADELDRQMLEQGYGPDLDKIAPSYWAHIEATFERAQLQKPENTWWQSGGKRGVHGEHMGYILAEMQHLQRAYPGQQW
ncbi:MAG: 1,2-phenylacetyl-CoA epoxidase subunit PaaC [Bacteroidota bacterium]